MMKSSIKFLTILFISLLFLGGGLVFILRFPVYFSFGLVLLYLLD